jgi:hypothetical protein
MRKNNRTYTVLSQHTAAFGESFSHRLLEPCAVLRTPVIALRLILHRFVPLGRKRVRGVEGIVSAEDGRAMRV